MNAQQILDAAKITGLEKDLRQAREYADKSAKILSLLIQLEPNLDKYQLDGNWGRIWDIEGMVTAIKFRIGRAAAEKYSVPVVKGESK